MSLWAVAGRMKCNNLWPVKAQLYMHTCQVAATQTMMTHRVLSAHVLFSSWHMYGICAGDAPHGGGFRDVWLAQKRLAGVIPRPRRSAGSRLAAAPAAAVQSMKCHIIELTVRSFGLSHAAVTAWRGVCVKLLVYICLATRFWNVRDTLKTRRTFHRDQIDVHNYTCTVFASRLDARTRTRTHFQPSTLLN